MRCYTLFADSISRCCVCCLAATNRWEPPNRFKSAAAIQVGEPQLALLPHTVIAASPGCQCNAVLDAWYSARDCAKQRASAQCSGLPLLLWWLHDSICILDVCHLVGMEFGR